LNKSTVIGVSAAALSFAAYKGAPRAVKKAIVIHDHFADALRAERALNSAGGETADPTKRTLGLRLFVATNERMKTTHRLTRGFVAGAMNWYSKQGSTVAQLSVGKQSSIEATSTGK
jgi:hypothetical protein